MLQEKPLAVNAEEGLELVKLQRKYPNIKIGICFQNRYNATFQALHEIVESKTYGEVIGVKGLVTWFRPESYYTDKPWRGQMATAGGGVLINQSIHTLDLMQFLCGKIASIKGTVSQLLDYDIEVEDTASAHIKFENKANGMFFATNANFGNSSVELQIIFEKDKLNQISKGTLQKINIIQALLSNGEILIFDEPFNGLDKKTESNFISLLKKLSKTRTIILTSHESNIVQSFTTHELNLHNGKFKTINTNPKFKAITFLTSKNPSISFPQVLAQKIHNQINIKNNSIKIYIDRNDTNIILNNLIKRNYKILEVKDE